MSNHGLFFQRRRGYVLGRRGRRPVRPGLTARPIGETSARNPRGRFEAR